MGVLFQKFVDYLNGKGLIFNERHERIKAGEGDGLWQPEECKSGEDMRRKANKRRLNFKKMSEKFVN